MVNISFSFFILTEVQAYVKFEQNKIFTFLLTFKLYFIQTTNKEKRQQQRQPHLSNQRTTQPKPPTRSSLKSVFFFLQLPCCEVAIYHSLDDG